MMRSHFAKTNVNAGRLLALVALSALLAACGGPAATPIVVVVTRGPAPTAETPRAELPSAGYEHPSGAFRVDLPQGAAIDTGEDSVFLLVDDTVLLIRFTVPEEPLDGDDLVAAIPPLADTALVNGGLIASYNDLEVEVNQAGDAAIGRMAMVSEQLGSGEAEILLWQVEHVLYMMVLVTPDYAAAREYWIRAMDSLVPSVESVPLPSVLPPPQPAEPTATTTPLPSATLRPTVQPTATPRPTVQPSATPRPQPQPSATSRPRPTATPPPSPPSGQGCYLFQNEIPAELTVTLTAQDRQWSDAIKVPANGTREYCLDPGRYTYTIDAPPPWGSTNGELVVNPGDRIVFPIKGG
jgi:hypothetical protein